MTQTKIGSHLKAAREQAGLSSGDAAKKIGVSAMTLSRYENDHRLPDANTLLSMTKVYGCDVVVLMTGTGGGRPTQVPVRGKMLDRTKFELDFSGPPKESLPIFSDQPGAYAVRVVGSAMQPIAYHNEYVILARQKEEAFLEISTRGENAELVRGDSVGQILGVFRKIGG